MENIEKK